MIKLLALLLLATAIQGVPVALAQDLESELPIEVRPELLPRSGSAPMILTCEIEKDDIIECATDRKLKKVECRLEASDVEVLKSKITERGFACQAPTDKRELSTSFGVFILGEDLNFSEWIVRLSSPQQLSRMYRAEMESAMQARPEIPPYSLGLNGRMFLAGSGGSNMYYGIDARMDFLRNFFGHIAIERPLSQGETRRFDDVLIAAGYKQNLPLEWLRVELDFGFHIMGDSNIKNLKAGDLGLAVRADVLPGLLAASLYARSQWPEVNQLRQSYEGGGKLEIGPFFTHWRVDLSGSLLSRVWTDSRHSVDGTFAYGQLGLAYTN